MSDRLKAEREAAAARRNLLTQDAIERTGITEEMIAELVARFYGRAREDALLGPVFAVVQNWDEHLAKLGDFWSSVVLMSGRYHGSPMRAHLPLSLVGDHFDRWLDLFEQTARDVCPPAAAALFIDKARASPTVLKWRRQRSQAASLRRVTCSDREIPNACLRNVQLTSRDGALHQFQHHRSGLQNHHAARVVRCKTVKIRLNAFTLVQSKRA